MSYQKLSISERPFVIENIIGHPRYITYLITYPDETSARSLLFLHDQVQHLQVLFPMLNTVVKIDDTRRINGGFVLREKTWSGEELVRKECLPMKKGRENMELEDELLEKELEGTGMGGTGDRPPWRVTRYTPSDERDGARYIALTISHVFTDGKGAHKLVEALLAESIDHLPREYLGSTKIFDIPSNKNPSHTPTPLSSSPIAWPDHAPLVPPQQCHPAQTSMLHLSTAQLDLVKTNAKLHGCSVHSTLLICIIKAISLVLLVDSTNRPLAITHNTPISLRNTALGHAHCTGGYFGHFADQLVVTPNMDLWAEARKIHDALNTPQGRLRALNNSLEEGIPSEDDVRVLVGMMEGVAPYEQVVEISNVGMADLPKGAADMVWSQSAMPFGQMLTVSVIGSASGLRAVGCWRDQCYVSTGQVKEVSRRWKPILMNGGD